MAQNLLYFDNSYDHPYSSYRYAYPHRIQEARRRAGMERYYQMKLREEHERNQLQQERLRQREEEIYHRAYAAAIREERRRAEIEKYYRMKLREENERNRLERERVRGREEEIHPQFRKKEQNQMTEHETSKEGGRSLFKLARGIDGSLYRIEIPDQPARQSNDVSVQKKLNNNQGVNHKTESQISRKKDLNTKETHEAILPKQLKKKNKKQITFIVEDASDSEQEEDYNSVWCQRRPKPGEWMEPVEHLEIIT